VKSSDRLTIGQLADRSGLAGSAIRFYEREGLISSERTAGGQRRYRRDILRRLAFIRAARTIGLRLDEIRDALSLLPGSRTPTKADWTRLSRSWRDRLDEEIDALVALRDGLDSCIGCGCLSLGRCAISNRQDVVAGQGPGARLLPARLRSGQPDCADPAASRTSRTRADQPQPPRRRRLGDQTE
jgi:MerR family transcriptional regulator, redox-sensitive transcriptional activator SoxR